MKAAMADYWLNNKYIYNYVIYYGALTLKAPYIHYHLSRWSIDTHTLFTYRWRM